MRLINADAKELQNRIERNFGPGGRFIVRNILNDAPTVEAEPVKHGRYIIDWLGDGYCSVCGEKWINVTHNYCPHCGAKMDLEVDDGGLN